MTIGELINELSQYDPESELKIEDSFGDEYYFNNLWQNDNSGDEDILNTYITMTILEA